MDFVDANHGWLVSESGIICYTDDGGDSWIRQDSGVDVWLSGVYFIDVNNGWVVGDNGIILHTDNGGETWQPQNSGVSVRLRGLHFVTSQSGWVVGDNGTILHTVDGGNSWTPQISGTEQTLEDVYFINPTTGWIVGCDGTILHTDNGGDTWSVQNSGVSNFLRGVVFVNANEGWAVGDGIILYTTDGGDSWTTQFTLKNRLQAICYDGEASLYAVGWFGIILKYVDFDLTGIIRGDVSGDRTISAYDAALILQYTVGLIDLFPAETVTSPGETTPRNYAVSLPSLTAKAGNRIQIPISINDATGLVAGGISVKYDSSVLWAIDVAISPWASGVYWRANTELDGEVRVAFAGAQPLEGKGNLFHVTYEVLPHAEGVTTPLILDGVQFSNSSDIATVNGWITVLPSQSMLFQNYPNPFNPETWIPFQLAQDAAVEVNIYNSKGQLIRTLHLGQKHAGAYVTKERAAYWNGRDEHGNRVASGLYFYTLQAGDFTATRKMVILK